jgi:hypothetical protein
VTTLRFSVDAEFVYERLDADPSRVALLDLIDEALDLLEENPGDPRVRQCRFSKIDGWGIKIRDRYEEWLIFWEPHLAADDEVVVSYIRPDPFA